jgi:hypothetical protein
MDGDAHLNNFGMYGTQQREGVFDLNDFDEAIIGPWEWDVTPGLSATGNWENYLPGAPSIRTKVLSRRDFPERCASTAWFVARVAV